MAEAVGDVGDEVEVLSLAAPEQTVDGVDYHADDVDVLPLVEAADVVGLGHLALVEYEVNRTGVVFDEEPVANVLALAVYGQRLAVTYVVDKQGNQFFGELVGPVVVGAVGHQCGHPVGVVIGSHEVVARCLGGGIRRVRIVFCGLGEELLAVGLVVPVARCLCGERSGHAFGMCQFECAVYLVGGDVVEELALVFFGQ